MVGPTLLEQALLGAQPGSTNRPTLKRSVSLMSTTGSAPPSPPSSPDANDPFGSSALAPVTGPGRGHTLLSARHRTQAAKHVDRIPGPSRLGIARRQPYSAADRHRTPSPPLLSPVPPHEGFGELDDPFCARPGEIRIGKDLGPRRADVVAYVFRGKRIDVSTEDLDPHLGTHARSDEFGKAGPKLLFPTPRAEYTYEEEYEDEAEDAVMLDVMATPRRTPAGKGPRMGDVLPPTPVSTKKVKNRDHRYAPYGGRPVAPYANA